MKPAPSSTTRPRPAEAVGVLAEPAMAPRSSPAGRASSRARPSPYRLRPPCRPQQHRRARGIERTNGASASARTTQAASSARRGRRGVPLLARATPSSGTSRSATGARRRVARPRRPGVGVPAVALALDAEMEAPSPDGHPRRRRRPTSSTGTWTTALADDEVLTASGSRCGTGQRLRGRGGRPAPRRLRHGRSGVRGRARRRRPDRAARHRPVRHRADAVRAPRCRGGWSASRVRPRPRRARARPPATSRRPPDLHGASVPQPGRGRLVARALSRALEEAIMAEIPIVMPVNGQARRASSSPGTRWPTSCASGASSPAPTSAASTGCAAPAPSCSTARPRVLPGVRGAGRGLRGHHLEGIARPRRRARDVQEASGPHGCSAASAPRLLVSVTAFLERPRPPTRRSARRSRQPLPLHRLPGDPPGDPGRRRGSSGG